MLRHTRFFLLMKHFLFTILLFLIIPALPANPKVVSLTPAVTEIICFLDGESMLIGRSTACDYPAHIKKLPAVGNYTGFFLEKLLAMKPDYVIANNFTAKDKRLKKHVKANFIEVPIKTIEDYINALKIIGRFLNCPEKGNYEAEKAFLKLQELKKNAAQQSNKPTAIWVIWHNPLMIAGPGSLPDTVMGLAGLKNAAANVKNEYFKCSREWLALQKPDYIIWTVNGVPFQQKGFWARYRKDQVISGLNHDILLRPGPRIFDGIDQLRDALKK